MKRRLRNRFIYGDQDMTQRLRNSAIGLLLPLAMLALFLWSQKTHAETGIVIPEVSATYRIPVERAASEYFGLNAPTSRLAAQIHQESRWRPNAASKYAQGLAQFTPSTAAWLPNICDTLQGFDRWDAMQSIRAISCYDAWLLKRVKPLGKTELTQCSAWAFALRGYNGGEGWMVRERRMALAANQDANDWIRVQPYRARATWAHKENTTYPRRILLTIEPTYRKAGWPGLSLCKESA